MTTPAQTRQDRRVLIALALLLLLAVGAGVGFAFGLPAAGPKNQSVPEANEEARVVAKSNAPEAPPEPETAAPPDNPPEERSWLNPPDKVDLGPLTRFRRLVLEADLALELVDLTGRPSLDEREKLRTKWIDAILLAMESKFAVFSGPFCAGTLTAEERKLLANESARLFRAPDVYKSAFTIDEQPRVALWLRAGARLPEAATGLPGKDVPLLRRRQEKIDATIATQWLEAMEAEFGNVDFGRDPQRLPMDIVISPNQTEYLDFARKRLGFAPPKWSAGFYSMAWDVALTGVNDSMCLAEVLRHEMFHALQAHLAPPSLFVPWFGEGTAEWLDKAPPDGAALRTDTLFAQAAMGYLGQLMDQGFVLKLREFLALDPAAFYQRPELNYLVAYCFVDFVRAEEDLRPVYFDFWKLMVQGVQHEQAFNRSFGVLDLAEVERRFLARVRSAPRQTAAPRFTVDGAPEYFDRMPASIEGDTALPGHGKVSDRWYEVLGKLSAAGIDVSRTPYLRNDFDTLVIAIDDTESMQQTFGEAFDYAAFGRWLFSMRYAAQLKLTRKTDDGGAEEEVPPQVLMALVEAVLTRKTDAFMEATGVKAGQELQDDVLKQWNESEFAAAEFSQRKKRDMCRLTAESMAWVWGVSNARINVTVVDFHINAISQSARGRFEAVGVKAGSNPIQQLFTSTGAANAPKGGFSGVDTGWSLALTKLVEAAEAGGKRVQCLFFTDGPNSSGTLSYQETGRNDELYFRDQKLLARDFNEAWQKAGLHGESKTGTMQLFALPGAENQGLDEIPTACPQAKLDNWWPRFRK